MHIVVVGAGLGGLTLSHALAKKGHTVDLIEKQPAVKSQLGAAIGLTGGLAVMRSLGLAREIDPYLTPMRSFKGSSLVGGGGAAEPEGKLTTSFGEAMIPEKALFELPPILLDRRSSESRNYLRNYEMFHDEGGAAASDSQRRRTVHGISRTALSDDESGPSSEAFMAMITREHLHALLHRTLPLNVSLWLNCNVVHVETISDGGTSASVTLSDGTRLTGDLVVGADGIHSIVRRTVASDDADGRTLTTSQRRYTGISGVYGLVVKHTFELMMKCSLKKDEKAEALLESLPVGGLHEFEGKGAIATVFNLKRHYMFVFFEAREDPPTSDENWTNPAVQEEISSKIKAQGMPSLFEHLLRAAPDGGRVVHLGLYESEPMRTSWSRGRAVLLGDSAHATTPFLGQGANQAMLDAWSLAFHLPPANASDYICADDDDLHHHIQKALHRYETARSTHATNIKSVSRMFGHIRLGITSWDRCVRRCFMQTLLTCGRGCLFRQMLKWASQLNV